MKRLRIQPETSMKDSHFRLLVLSAAILSLGSLALAGRMEGGYHLLKKYDLSAPPGGKEYWDYITFDPSTRRLYISHNTEVKALDAISGAVVGSIPDLQWGHSIVLIRRLGQY